MIKLAISGAHGRMGMTITQLALQKTDQFHVNTLLEHSRHPKLNECIEGIQANSDNNLIKGSNVLIEFTSPEATIENLKACLKHNVKMVIGTTGFNEQQEAEIRNAAKTIPIVFASNMSMGVNVLFKLIETASQKLPGLTDIFIGETHHIHKKDKPSGTAKTMQKIAQDACDQKARFDEKNVKREGEVIGYHEITFETEFDTLKIIHNAKDRAMFAKGALEAAKFLTNKKNGLYTMYDVLGLE